MSQSDLTEATFLNSSLLEAAVRICGQVGAKAIFVHIDPIRDLDKDLEPLERRPQELACFISTCSAERHSTLAGRGCRAIQLPDLPLGRLDTIKMGVLIALSEGSITKQDTIVCLSGLASNGLIDTLMVFRLDQETEMFQTSEAPSAIDGADPKVFETVLSMALELAAEGREGKPLGALLVLGDHELVLQYSRQLVINPFHGYPEEQRNILDPALRETIKEFSAIDGAFVIRGDGVIEAAGRHLSAAPRAELPMGLGARHMAASGITEVSSATSFAVSESTGTVSVFKDGKILMQINKSQTSQPARRKKKSP
ncbi:MAG: DNA integrity scanning protein DisA nucleotide-binding domain protein [Candidatus Tectomicrobia bacterium]|uniref:DNA integrity scanning protein DisA nucleotide-binding domain protein n=1 Tax=Tectimicrobiota bacterium TaxID=2528274 RepID=A0A932MQB7_UNCTE|nr:DNA integrity scanning protein DisA nucleotide-binding domain protein [Candidatus Tectomicrobia bacterium]